MPEETPPLDRDAVMERGDRLWAELAAACDASLETPLHAEGDVLWTGREVYGHFAHMHAGTLSMLRRAVETGEVRWDGAVPGETEDQANERERTANAERGFAELRQAAHASREELRAFLLALDEEQWARWGHRRYIDDFEGGHYQGHLDYIHRRQPEDWR